MTITTSGVIAKSFEHGMEHLREFALRDFNSSYNYCLLMDEGEGVYRIVERVGMPCWGALREYHSGTSPNTDYWPGDLREPRHIFPAKGNPVAVSTILQRGGYLKEKAEPNKGYTSYDDWNQFIEFVYNPELSPYRQALKGFELLKDKHAYRGVVITNTDIPPSAMLALFRTTFNQSATANNFGQVLRDNPGLDPRIAYLKASKISQYYLSEKMNLKLFFNGTIREGLDEGKSYHSRMKYNRPEIEFIFDTKDKDTVAYKQMSIADLNKQLALS